ncbi:MAG: wax ester/triacylglycerol synthase family O-acyltransferase [Caldilinea sp.]|jgi:WS/DGAT/MGAT family acyltransferase|nr:wax ester/triacylglycerol synthase family O-acyltransferase [Caldilinea sp.]
MSSTRVPVSSVDKVWFEMDCDTNRMIINGLMWFDGIVDHTLCAQILESRFVQRYARFRQRIVAGLGGRLFWEQDPHFDLRNHFCRLSPPQTEEGLQRLVNSLIHEPLDRQKPLWRFYLVDELKGSSVLFGRIHHCVGDGMALIRVLLNMTSETLADSVRPHRAASAASLPPAGLWRKSRQVASTALDAVKTAASQTLLTLENPARLLRTAQALGIFSATAAAILAKLLLLRPDRRTTLKGNLGTVKQVVWSAPFNLETIKTIGRAFDATVNDVLVSAVAGALREYLLQIGEDPDSGDIRAMVPVNLRPDSQTRELGNQFALIYLPLPISRADPTARLLHTKQHMDLLKRSPEPLLVYQVLSLIGSLPLELARQVTLWFSAKASAVLTNVPGPRQPIYFAGLPLRQLMFWVPQSGEISLGISIISYNGQVILGLMVDENCIAEPNQIMHHFTQQFEALAVQANAAGRSSCVP